MLGFCLFDAAMGGSQIGQCQTLNVPMSEGLFTVVLNVDDQFGVDAFEGDRRWLQISVEGVTLLPRQEVSAMPYALFAARPWETAADGGLSYIGGNVGVGTGTPDSKLEVRDAGSGERTILTLRTAESEADTVANLDWAWAGNVHSRISSLSPAPGQVGLAFYTYEDVADPPLRERMRIGASGHVGIGTNTPTERLTVAGGRIFASGTGPDTGIQFSHLHLFEDIDQTLKLTSPSGYNVALIPEGNIGIGTATPVVGKLHVENSAPGGTAVFGSAPATSGQTYGGRFLSFGDSAVGVLGWAPSSSGPNYGVFGRSDSPSGYGVFGSATATGGAGYGVFGRSDSPSGSGVFGLGFNGLGTNHGLHGQSISTNPGAAAVLAEGNGTSSPGSPRAAALDIRNGAIRVSGNVRPAGTISVGATTGLFVVSSGTGPTCCPHNHAIGVYLDVSLENALIVSDSMIIATIETPGAASGTAYFVQVFGKTAGSCTFRVTASGSSFSPSMAIGPFLIHYQITNPAP